MTYINSDYAHIFTSRNQQMKPLNKDSFEYAKTIEKTIVSRTYGPLYKAKHSARQAFEFIKYTLIKSLKTIKMAESIVYTLMYRYVNKYYAEF